MSLVMNRLEDGVYSHAIDLTKIETELRQKVLGHLVEMEKDLTSQLQSELITDFKRQRLEGLLSQTRQTIATAHQQIKATVQSYLNDFSKFEEKANIDMLNQAVGVPVFSVMMTPQQLSVIASNVMVQGGPLGEWLGSSGSLSETTKRQFANQIRMGVAQGEPIQDIVKRIRGNPTGKRYSYRTASGKLRYNVEFEGGVLPIQTRQAKAMVRTSVHEVSNRVRDGVYEENAEIIKVIESVATLDSRTTPLCASYDGLRFYTTSKKPVGGHKKKFLQVPRHWQCRSTYIPILAELNELDKLAKKQGLEVPEPVRAAVDGLQPTATDMDTWLKNKSVAFQNKLIESKAKADLWRDGKIRLRDLTDNQGKVRTLAQLESRYAQTACTSPTPAVMYPAPPKAPKPPPPAPDLPTPKPLQPVATSKKATDLALAQQEAIEVSVSTNLGRIMAPDTLPNLVEDHLKKLKKMQDWLWKNSEDKAQPTVKNFLKGLPKTELSRKVKYKYAGTSFEDVWVRSGPTAKWELKGRNINGKKIMLFTKKAQEQSTLEALGKTPERQAKLQKRYDQAHTQVTQKKVSEELIKKPEPHVIDTPKQDPAPTPPDPPKKVIESITGKPKEPPIKVSPDPEKANVQLLKEDFKEIMQMLVDKEINYNRFKKEVYKFFKRGIDADFMAEYASTFGPSKKYFVKQGISQGKEAAKEKALIRKKIKEEKALAEKAKQEPSPWGGVEATPWKKVEKPPEKAKKGLPPSLKKPVTPLGHVEKLKDLDWDEIGDNVANLVATPAYKDMVDFLVEKIPNQTSDTFALIRQMFIKNLGPKSSLFKEEYIDKWFANNFKPPKGMKYSLGKTFYLPDEPIEVGFKTPPPPIPKPNTPLDALNALSKYKELTKADGSLTTWDEIGGNVANLVATQEYQNLVALLKEKIPENDMSFLNSLKSMINDQLGKKNAIFKQGVGLDMWLVDNFTPPKGVVLDSDTGKWFMDEIDPIDKAIENLKKFAEAQTTPTPVKAFDDEWTDLQEALYNHATFAKSGAIAKKLQKELGEKYPETFGGKLGKYSHAEDVVDAQVLYAKKQKGEAVQETVASDPEKPKVPSIQEVTLWDAMEAIKNYAKTPKTIVPVLENSANLIVKKFDEGYEKGIEFTKYIFEAIEKEIEKGGTWVGHEGWNKQFVNSILKQKIINIKTDTPSVATNVPANWPDGFETSMIAGAKTMLAQAETPKAKPLKPKKRKGGQEVIGEETRGAPIMKSMERKARLGGSTGAELWEDKNGKKWVVKKGATPEHVVSESITDALYKSAGIDVPKQYLIKQDDGSIFKVSEFQDPDSVLLSDLKRTDPARYKVIKNKLADNFIYDVLFENWDVIGLEYDNIMVTPQGKIMRIDNGSGLKFRAQGGPKKFLGNLDALNSLRNASINPSSAEIFGGLTDKDLKKQFKKALKKKEKILAVLDRHIAKSFESDHALTLTEDYTAIRNAMQERFSMMEYRIAEMEYKPKKSKLKAFPYKGPEGFEEFEGLDSQQTTKKSKQWKAALETKVTDRELRRIRKGFRSYTGSEYGRMRDLLLKKPNASASNWGESKYGEIVKAISDCEYAWEHAPKFKGTVYRGTTINKAGDEYQKKYYNDVMYGDEIELGVYTSTSTAESVSNDWSGRSSSAESFKFIIKANGRGGRSVESMSNYSSEREVLYRPEARFKITKRVEVGHRWVIYMEEL